MTGIRHAIAAVLMVSLVSGCMRAQLPSQPSTNPAEPSPVTQSLLATATNTVSPAPSATVAIPATGAPALDLTATPNLAPEAAAYLNEVLDIIQAKALRRDKPDWPIVRATAFAMADGAQTSGDTYSVIRYVLEALGDNHSYLMEPEMASAIVTGASDSQNIPPRGELLEGGLGYLFVPGFAGSAEAALEYADVIQDTIRNLDQSEPCGWVVDLSANSGGNMWPMLAGVGPLLGDGVLGAFKNVDGYSTYWYYHEGQVLVGEEIVLQLDQAAYIPPRGQPPVAVITGRLTASSGEAVVVAFRGRPDTRSFGEPTRGLSTGNGWFNLSDGAVLALTTVRFVDRTGQVYGAEIYPDVEVNAVRRTATEWLLSLPECQRSTADSD